MITAKQRERIDSGGAFIRNGKVFCIAHNGIEIDAEGDCHVCYQNECLIGLDRAEAQAMRIADCLSETDDDSTLEENLPYYQQENDEE